MGFSDIVSFKPLLEGILTSIFKINSDNAPIFHLETAKLRDINLLRTQQMMTGRVKMESSFGGFQDSRRTILLFYVLKSSSFQ